MIWLISKLIFLVTLINIINTNHISFLHLYNETQDESIKLIYLYNRYFLFTMISITLYYIIRELHYILD